MKAALSLTLIICVVALGVPVGAADADVAAGPIGRAITREAVRLAAEPAGIEPVQRSGAPAQSDWSRVRTLDADAKIFLNVRGSSASEVRRFVRADESSLTVRKDSSRQDEQIARGDAVEIRRSPGLLREHPAKSGALMGLGSVVLVGGLLALSGRSCGKTKGGECELTVLMSLGLGAGIGAVVGAAIGATRNKTQDIIYRAP